MSRRVLVTGSRHWVDQSRIWKALEAEMRAHGMSHLIHGDARGADKIAGAWARNVGIAEVRVPAQWDIYHDQAGRIRNEWMMDLNPEVVLAFPLHDSKGTKHCMRLGRLRGIPVRNLGQELKV